MSKAYLSIKRLSVICSLFLCLLVPKAFSNDGSQTTSHFECQKVEDKYLKAQKNVLSQNREIKEEYTFSVLKENFIGFPNVFSPKICFEDGFFVEHLPIKQGDCVLEIGAGTGFFPVFAVRKGATHVVATDVNPDAVKNILANAKLHKMESQIQALESDIFKNISPQSKFDVIYWNIPFTPTQEQALTLLDLSVFDPENKFLERYLKESGQFLKSDGTVYLGYSSTHGDVAKMKALAEKYNWSVKLIAQAGNVDSIIVQLYEFKQVKK